MTPQKLVKGTGHSVPLERHPEHSTKPKGHKLWETSIFCPPITGSEVNDSWPVNLRHWALKGPLDCAQNSDWKIPLILFLCFFSFSFIFFCFKFYFIWGSKEILFYLRCPITFVFRDSHGLLNLSSRARHLGIL